MKLVNGQLYWTIAPICPGTESRSWDKAHVKPWEGVLVEQEVDPPILYRWFRCNEDGSYTVLDYNSNAWAFINDEADCFLTKEEADQAYLKSEIKEQPYPTIPLEVLLERVRNEVS